MNIIFSGNGTFDPKTNINLLTYSGLRVLKNKKFLAANTMRMDISPNHCYPLSNNSLLIGKPANELEWFFVL